MKVARQLTLKQEAYPGLSGASTSQESLEWKREATQEPEGTRAEEEGGEGAALLAPKTKEAATSP